MHEIKIDHMAKIYGHASLEVRIRGNKVRKAQLNVFESSRFFESLVSGKRFDEARRITSRICGICAASHNITSIMAVENALGIRPERQVELLREALILGGWIQSHALHTYFLALPDYLGYGSILDMADRRPEDVERGFRLKKLGNDIIEAIGGRPTHPITTDAGYFTRVPEKEGLALLLKSLRSGLRDAVKTARLFSSFRKPEFERERPMGSLADNKTYAILSGSPAIGGRQMENSDFTENVIPEKRPYSTSKFLTFKGGEYMVGPLARLNANSRYLMDEAKSLLKRCGPKLPDCNPFSSNMARAIETVHCIEKCCRAIREIRPDGAARPSLDFKKTGGGARRGCAITEAPRGMLYHEYTLDSRGFIISSNIITPTAQNLNPMECDVKAFLPSVLGRPKKTVILELEKLIRSYDPCISCAAHFLDVKFR